MTQKNENPQSKSGGGAGSQQGQQPQAAQSQPSEQQQRSMQQVRRMPRSNMFALPFMGGPFGVMRRLFDDLEQLAGIGPMEPSEQGERAPMAMFVPQVDISQRNDKLVVQADLPGMSPDDVRIRIEDGALILEGERRSEREMEAGGTVRTERFYGRFQRVVPLPEGADLDSAEARFENGVLEISLKTPPRQRGRQIEIKTGGEQAGAKSTTKH